MTSPTPLRRVALAAGVLALSGTLAAQHGAEMMFQPGDADSVSFACEPVAVSPISAST